MLGPKILTTMFSLWLTAGVAEASAIAMQPVMGGLHTNGNGVNSQWVQVHAIPAEYAGGPGGWHSVIHSGAWATGIWGLADANNVLGLDGTDPHVVASYSGVLDRIHWADKRYIDTWAPTWGTQDMVPFFNNDASQYQDNYAVRFSGFIAITDPGLYNFGVLYDDGFLFNLYGHGQTLSLMKDGLNSRDRLGFDMNLQLDAGLYGFDLIAWERLEAGVVDLSWIRPGGDWTTIPKPHLYTSAVPEPASILLLFAGLVVLAWRLRKRVALA